MWNKPHVTESLDGTHIAMDYTKGSRTKDYNYKGFYSLVLLTACDKKVQVLYGKMLDFTAVTTTTEY